MKQSNYSKMIDLIKVMSIKEQEEFVSKFMKDAEPLALDIAHKINIAHQDKSYSNAE